MSHRSIGLDAKSGPLQASSPAARYSVRNTVRTALNATGLTLSMVGVSAVAVAAMLYARPEMARQVSTLINPATAPVATLPVAPAVLPEPAPAIVKAAPPVAVGGSVRQQQAVTSWLSRRYRVAGDAANLLVSTAYTTARDIKLDPLLILAVMAIESGLNPFAESPVGAKGLMQVMEKVHHDKFAAVGGAKGALNPVANIRVGSQLLKEYVNRGGSVEAGLKTYVGAGAFDSDAGYGSRVLAEYHRLKMVASGKSVPTFFSSAPIQAITEKAVVPHHEAEPVQAPPPAVPAEEVIAGL